MRSAAALLCVLALLAGTSLVAFAAVIITPWGPPQTETFPADSVPDDMDPDADADATPGVWSSAPIFDGDWNPADSTYTVDSLGDVIVSGSTLLRLPDDADDDLREHENGHDRLNAWEYERCAKQKFEEALRGFVGMKFKGAGATNAARLDSARALAAAELDRRKKRAEESIKAQMSTLSDDYDGFTEHGRSDSIDTAEGEARARAVRLKAAPPGGNPLRPGPGGPMAAIEAGETVLHHAASQRLSVSGAGIIQGSAIPGDPIAGRGWIHLDSLIHIGLTENGSVHLADARLRIEDVATGDTLLDGCLLEPAYVASTVPGYAGMVQGYLGILPDWAGGISNTIGSPFLTGLQVARDMGLQTTVWLLASAPLFDPDGTCRIPPGGIAVAVVLGVGHPAPAAVEEPVAAARRGLEAFPQPGRGAVHFSWQPVGRPVDLEVYDVSGARRQMVRLEGSRGDWTWTGRDEKGQPVKAGVYFARLRGGGVDLRARVVIVR